MSVEIEKVYYEVMYGQLYEVKLTLYTDGRKYKYLTPLTSH